MSAQGKRLEWSSATAAPPAWVSLLAYAMVVFVFIGDWILPDSIVIDIAYEAPVFFAVLRGTQRLTILTVALGCVGIVLGWFVDFEQASFQFSDERIENRLLSLVSLLIVGSLATLIQRNARRAEELETERARSREFLISGAADRIMAALSPGRTIEAIAGEAPAMLEATAAVWCPARSEGVFWVTQDGATEATALPGVKASPAFAELMRRLGAQHSVEIVSAAESIEYVAGKPFGSKDALAIPVGDATTIEGIVFAALKGPGIDERALAVAGNFARFASTAVRQAHFVQELELRTSGGVVNANRAPDPSG